MCSLGAALDAELHAFRGGVRKGAEMVGVSEEVQRNCDRIHELGRQERASSGMKRFRLWEERVELLRKIAADAHRRGVAKED